jgi:hypothetical protein
MPNFCETKVKLTAVDPQPQYWTAIYVTPLCDMGPELNQDHTGHAAPSSENVAWSNDKRVPGGVGRLQGPRARCG